MIKLLNVCLLLKYHLYALHDLYQGIFSIHANNISPANIKTTLCNIQHLYVGNSSSSFIYASSVATFVALFSKRVKESVVKADT